MASMITMFLQSAYSMIDGLFVSNLIGDTALSAVNVAWPVIAVVTAIGTGVGCSGAVMMSTKQGEGKNEESNIVRANVILALLASSIVVTILFLVLLTPLLKLMGAEGELLRLSQIYGRVMLTGGVLQILSCGLTPLLRNDNRAVSAMMIMVGGLFANLGLDFVFMYVFHMGIGGAAGASLCAQLFTTLCCLIILGTKKTDPIRFSQFMIRKEYWKKIFKTAVSPFGISLTPSLLILYHNVACLKFGGDLAVNAYALISSTVGSYRVLMVTAAQLIFTGLVRVTNSFFYSVGKDKYSLFMIYFDPLIMTPLTIVILPRILGLDGIWITAVVTQFILNIVAFGMFASHERQMKRMEAAKTLAGK